MNKLQKYPKIDPPGPSKTMISHERGIKNTLWGDSRKIINIGLKKILKRYTKPSKTYPGILPENERTKRREKCPNSLPKDLPNAPQKSSKIT